MNLVTTSALLIALALGLAEATPPLQLEPFRSLFHPDDLPQPKFEGQSEFGSKLRLPNDLIPSAYELFIRPIIHEQEEGSPDQRYTAPGWVTIDFRCAQATSSIQLHNNGPVIDESSIIVRLAGTMDPIPFVNITIDHDNYKHFYIINMVADLTVGAEYQVYIEFVAPISQGNLDGLYYGSYWAPGPVGQPGSQKDLCATQLEAYHARQIFPCFDEPHLKARFTVHISRLESDTALCNTELTGTTDDAIAGWKVDSFAASPIMPTYLLAIQVSEFTSAEADSSLFHSKVRTYAAPHLIDRGDGDYSAEHAAKILQFLEDEYVEPYPIVKMDSSALPNFSAGAMENYGLNKYRTVYLLYNEGETVETSRYTIDSILGHELAHQWFGNLISCGWWTQLWLNEGFATYISYLAVMNISSEWKAEHRLLTEAFQPAMRYDVSPNSHPIVNNALTPPEIDGIFSTITYEKGGSIIRMMDGFLGSDTLRKGLRAFLSKKQYQPAFTDELWDSLTEAALEDEKIDPSLTMKDIMDSWTLQKGFPLVRVSRASADRIYISQERFSLDGRKRNKRDIAENALWHIPISIASAGDTDFDNHTPELWIETGVALRSYEINTNQWLLLNPDATGFYRVLYDYPLLNLILNQLETDPSVISALSRAQLLDDYFNLAFNSYTQIENALDLTTLLSSESERVVWDTFFTNMRKSFNMFSSTETFDHLRAYLLPFLNRVLEELGTAQPSGEVGENVILRAQILDWACPMGSTLCQTYANDLFNTWATNPANNPVPIDQQRVIYCAGVSFGSFEAFDFIFERYRNEVSEIQRGHLLSALACTKEQTLLLKMLELALDEQNGFHKADTTVAFQRVAANSVGRRTTLTFLREYYQTIVDYTGSTSTITSAVSTLATYFNTESELEDLRAWIEELRGNVPDGVITSLEGSASTIEANIRWMGDFHEYMKDWLVAKRNP